MYREPIKTGKNILINGVKYTIENLVARGGTSLVYQVKEENGLHPWIVKEFYPQNKIAYRDNKETIGKIVAYDGQIEIFKNLKERFFHQESELGNLLSVDTFQALCFDEIDESNGFALMRPFSRDTISLLDLVKQWEKNNPAYDDKEYKDLERVIYALRIAEALLLLLDKLHDNNILHLDLSYNNIMWGGLDKEVNGKHSNVFLLDFGCSAKMDDGKHYKDNPLFYSYSSGFSAPEIRDTNNKILDVKTDLYSISALLFFLCVGKEAVKNEAWEMHDKLWNRHRLIRDCLLQVKIPKEFEEELTNIILGNLKVASENRNYNSAIEMYEAINKLSKKLINYEKPHLDLPRVKPITQNYVKHPQQTIDKIKNILDTYNICCIYGMSGSGKSELIRQFADEQCTNKTVLEIYFPENGDNYTIEDLVSSLKNNYVNLKDYSKEEEISVLRNLLKEEIVILIHNFNNLELMKFINKELMSDNIKLLITSQCTNMQLEWENIPNDCLIELKPNEFFCAQIFKEIHRKYKKALPIEEAKILELSKLLFNMPLLIDVVVNQMILTEDDDFKRLIKDLNRDALDEIFEETSEVTYFKENNVKIQGTPFDIIYSIIQKMLPPLSELEKQCLQVVTRIPNEWIMMNELARILGDLPNDRRCKKAIVGIKKLINKHILIEKKINGLSYVSIHALLVVIILSKKNKPEYITEPTLEFWQHLERNAISGTGKYDYDIILSSDNVINSMFRNLRLLEYKEGGLRRKFLNFEESKPLIELNNIIDDTSNQSNGNNEICTTLDKPYKFDLIIIHCKNGVIVGTYFRDKYIVGINAGNQLVPHNRYYNLKSSMNEYQITPLYCCVKVYIHNQASEKMRIENNFLGIPIKSIYYFGDNSIVTSKKLSPQILSLPSSCKKVGGCCDSIVKLEINCGLLEYNFVARNIKKISLPKTVQNVSGFSLNSAVEEVIIDNDNEFFISIDGCIFSKDLNRLLFLPPKHRKLNYPLPQKTKQLNLTCMGYTGDDFKIENLSIYILEEYLKRKADLTNMELTILETQNDLDINTFCYRAQNVIKKYYENYDVEKDCFLKKYLNENDYKDIMEGIKDKLPKINENSFRRTYDIYFKENFSCRLISTLASFNIETFFLTEEEVYEDIKYLRNGHYIGEFNSNIVW